MKIGFSFNYWMIVIPALYVLGCVAGYWSVWPGKKKALRRPFNWRSNLPIAVVTLLYGVLIAIVTATLLFVESRLGIIEFLGRDEPAAIFLMPMAIAFCAVITGLGTIYSMVELRLWHRKRLINRWVKRQAEKQQAMMGSGKVIAMPTRRRRRKFRQAWSDFKSCFFAKIRKKKDQIWPSQMTLPEKVVQEYRRG